jgi:predicted 2-oxoglutarate/Fe(II)-dependent dioxygenase YbiX
MQYTEEAKGVLALTLYDTRSTSSAVKCLKRSNGWTAAEIRKTNGRGDYYSVTKREYRSASILELPKARSVYQSFERKIETRIKPLINRVWRLNLTEHDGTQIVRYRRGGHYVAHADAGLDLAVRYFTVICYLNDDYAGGQTHFPSLNHTTVPQRGKAIIFPSEYMHSAEPVTRGEKYILVTWILGPVPVSWI